MEYTRTMATEIKRADLTQRLVVTRNADGYVAITLANNTSMRIEDAERLVSMLKAGIAEAERLLVV